MLRLLTFIFALTLSLSPVHAWFDIGHEVIGEIAWSQLDQKTREKVNELLKQLAPAYEEAASLAAISKLPDNMRSGLKIFDSWHYVDLPYLVAGAVAHTALTQDIVWALCECVRTIRANQPNPQFQPKPFEKALMFPHLAHLVGDLHQPLHAISRYTPMLPNGDLGGNLFPVRQGASSTNLHSLWDSGVGVLKDPLAKFVINTGKSPKTDELAATIMKDFPPKYFGKKIEETVFRQWALDSHEIARNIAYDIVEGSEPSTTYISKGQKIAKERIALAGYRLAFLLQQLLGDKSGTLVTGCQL